jgi:hypothetical protein
MMDIPTTAVRAMATVLHRELGLIAEMEVSVLNLRYVTMALKTLVAAAT